MTRVLVLSHHYTTAGTEGDCLPLREALDREYPYDAMICQYESTRQLDKSLSASIKLVGVFFDIEPPRHGPLTPEWLEAEEDKMLVLQAEHEVYIYSTRGGYRIVATLPTPIVVSSQEEWDTWRAWYLACCSYLARRFGIEPDRSCAHPTARFRAPRALRDGVQLSPEIEDGHPGPWLPALTAADVAAAKLAAQTSPDRADDLRLVLPGTDEQMAAAREYARTAPPAVQGEGGDHRLYAVARGVAGHGLNAEQVERVLLEDFNPRCLPPWAGSGKDGLERLRYKAEQAVSKRNPDLEGSATDWFKGLNDPKEDDGHVLSFTARLRARKARGPKVPTGFAPLDQILRGGLWPVLYAVGGAPGAGKTTLARQIASDLARRGVPVIWSADDENSEGIDIRRMQEIGIPRDWAEAPSEEIIAKAGGALEHEPFTILEGKTIEECFAEGERLYPGKFKAYFFDSLQKARTEQSSKIDSLREKTDQKIATMKRLGRETGAAVIFTSELNRSSYRSKNKAEQIDDLAAFKESGDIEYSCHFAAVLRWEDRGSGVVSVAVAKNREGIYDGFNMSLSLLTSSFRLDERTEEDLETIQEEVIVQKELGRRDRGRAKILQALKEAGGLISGQERLREACKLRAADLRAALKVLVEANHVAEESQGTGRATAYRLLVTGADFEEACTPSGSSQARPGSSGTRLPTTPSRVPPPIGGTGLVGPGSGGSGESIGGTGLPKNVLHLGPGLPSTSGGLS